MIAVLPLTGKQMLHNSSDTAAVGDDAGVLFDFGECIEHTLFHLYAAIMEHLFPGEGKNRYEWQPKNGCGYIIRGNTYEELP